MILSDKEYQKLLESLPEALFLEDLEGNILRVNEEACRMLGYEREELLNLDVEDLEPEDAPIFLPDQVDEATRSGEPLETTKIKKDGTEIPVELKGKILEIKGQKIILVTVRDISERVEANEELRRNKERYQSYFEELGDAVFITKVGEDHGRILEANTAAEDQTGYSEEELLGMNIEDDIAAEAPETIDYKTGDKKIKQGETVNFTEKKRRKDGTEYWTEVLITPIEYEGETASLSINRDITERKRTQEQLEQYQMAVQGSDDLIAACDEDYNYIFANPAYRGFYNVGEEEIRNYKLGDLISDSAFENEVKPRVDRCLQGERIDYEMERTHPTKGQRQLRIMYYPLKSEKRIHGVVAVMRDITTRKEAERKLQEREKKYRQIFNKANDAMYVHKLTEEGMPGQFIEVNDVACEMLGYSKEELLSMAPRNIDGGGLSENVPDIMEDLISEGHKTFEMQHETKDGDLIPVEVSSHVFEMDGEKRVLSIARDITERKRAQQELNEERDKLRHLHDAVDQLQKQNDEESILQTAVEVSESILDFELCAIDLIEGEYLETKAISSGLSIDQTSKYKIGEGIGGLTAERGETIWGDDLREHPEAKPTNKEFRAFISVPIGEVGVFQVVSKEVGSFDEEDVELAEILSNHLREEISRVRLEEDLRQQAIHD
ncbi:MAG: PAS domain S-box protein, partial [Candidatus Bipolaricaulia bacterium]